MLLAWCCFHLKIWVCPVLVLVVMLLWWQGRSPCTDLQLEAGPGLELGAPSSPTTAGIVNHGRSTANNHLSSHTIHHKHSIIASLPSPLPPPRPQIYFCNPGGWGKGQRLLAFLLPASWSNISEIFLKVMGQLNVVLILIYHFCIGGEIIYSGYTVDWLRPGILNR